MKKSLLFVGANNLLLRPSDRIALQEHYSIKTLGVLVAANRSCKQGGVHNVARNTTTNYRRYGTDRFLGVLRT